MSKRLILATTLLLLLLDAVPSAATVHIVTGPCSLADMAQYIDTVTPAIRAFDGVAAVARRTPRIALPPLIAALYTTRMAADTLDVPACAAAPHALMYDYMDQVLHIFTLYLVRGQGPELQAAIREADRISWEYRDALMRAYGVDPDADLGVSA